MVNFSRKTLQLDPPRSNRRVMREDSQIVKLVNLKSSEALHKAKNSLEDSLSVLVINSSHEIAKEITLQLQLKLSGCSIMYAPTIELAAMLIRRRKIDLIVSCPVLPDGTIAKLRSALQDLEDAPDLVVVGEVNAENAEAVSELNYHYSSMRSLNQSKAQEEFDSHIKVLGADIRNDINNPLQEIVAMVFVAKSCGESPTTSPALDAIERAAKNLAVVARGIEDKIRGIVTAKVANSSP